MRPIITLLCVAGIACGQNPSPKALNGANQTTYESTVNNTQSVCNEDSIIYTGIIAKATHAHWQANGIGATIVNVSDCLKGLPYIGGTLEVPGEEHLVVDLRELDCTTFVENMVAISLCINKGETDYDDFKRALTRLRYRGGIINQYPSRLHYFTEWLLDNKKKGIIDLVTDGIGTAPYVPNVSFMSSHPDKYAALSNNPLFVEQIRKAEKEIAAARLKFIPKAQVSEFEDKIHDGDIIAIATSMRGLDIANVGIALHRNGRLYMTHASSSAKKVVTTDVPLCDYLAGITKHTGILVARVK